MAPFEKNMVYGLKLDKYEQLQEECEIHGCLRNMFPIEVKC